MDFFQFDSHYSLDDMQPKSAIVYLVQPNEEAVPFTIAPELEKIPGASGREALATFLAKGGAFQSIRTADPSNEKIQIMPGDAVYPVCSGGWCRSQALWAMLRPYSDQILLFAPYAARYGWDPYNGQVNRYLNIEKEVNLPDEFPLFFGHEKAVRFGFEHEAEWRAIEKSTSWKELRIISAYYNFHYFSDASLQEYDRFSRRIYITFEKNAHVVLYRLNQANADLSNVHVIFIDMPDVMTSPPAFLNTTPRSAASYEYFTGQLEDLLDLSYLRSSS